MQPGDEAPTVAITAASFNTTAEIVRQCVRESEWMCLDGSDDDPTKQRVETRESEPRILKDGRVRSHSPIRWLVQ